MEGDFGHDTIMNFTTLEKHKTIPLEAPKQVSIEKTDNEVKVSEIKPLDFGGSTDDPGLDFLDFLEYLTSPADLDLTNVDTSGDNTMVIDPACELFKGAAFSHVYGPWLPGAPLPVNVKMPANVAWQALIYNLKIGDAETEACAPLEGNNTRLSCKIALPSGYAGTYNQYVLTLHLDGCGEPIYSVGTLSLPVPEPADTSEKPKDEDEHTNTCDAYAPDQIACESGGGIWDLLLFSCTCP